MEYANTHVTLSVDRRLSEAAEMGFFDDETKPVSTLLRRANSGRVELQEAQELIGEGIPIHISRLYNQTLHAEGK